MKPNMPGKHLYEYAVIRVVPRVEREEFFNAGVIVFSKQLKYLKAKVHLHRTKVHALCGGVDCDEVQEHLDSLCRIAAGDTTAGPIALLDTPLRFRWLTATRSTIVQASKVHPGFCDDPDKVLEKLFEQMVM